MINIVLFILVISAIIIALGILFGGIFFERILFITSFNNHVIVMIVILSLLKDNSSLIDIAIIYALLSCIVNIFLLKKYRDKRL